MPDGFESYLPDDSSTQQFLFLVLFLVVLPVVVILVTRAPSVLLAAIGVGFIVWLFRETGVVGGSNDDADEEADPLQTLQDRYARGEIDDAEFERRLDRLVEMENLDLADAADDAERVLERER